MGIIYTIIIGLIAGTIYSRIEREENSISKNLVIGIAGAVIGGLLFDLLGIGFWFIGDIAGGVLGVFILFWVVDNFF